MTFKMEQDINDTIHPDEWTTKELVKHLYREINEINKEQVRMSNTLRLLEDDMRMRKWLYAFISSMAGFIGASITMFIKWFKS